ncbi:cobalt-precorrin-8X methylmutase [Salmonella enterica subsp. enterica]|uniref:Cobalt-precorrin-8X methylmutase n=1 Tax=Salmonella enterica I TaxID=59201 RepID=A0A379VPR6_SALET|nr:cobalt-precorrin-8X methylmutase [Salmonella enterica subsp. enterica]
MWFSADALEQLCDALRQPCIIYTDTTMALSGINKRLLATFGGECRCYISDPRVVRAAKTQGITRSMAAVDIAIAEEEKTNSLFSVMRRRPCSVCLNIT